MLELRLLTCGPADSGSQDHREEPVQSPGGRWALRGSVIRPRASDAGPWWLAWSLPPLRSGLWPPPPCLGMQGFGSRTDGCWGGVGPGLGVGPLPRGLCSGVASSPWFP